jgi:hypothetical protein
MSVSNLNNANLGGYVAINTAVRGSTNTTYTAPDSKKYSLVVSNANNGVGAGNAFIAGDVVIGYAGNTSDLTVTGNESLTNYSSTTLTTPAAYISQGLNQPYYAAPKGYVDAKISELMGGAPSTLDTLKEISDLLTTDGNLISGLTTTIATKVGNSGAQSISGTLSMTNGTTSAILSSTSLSLGSSSYSSTGLSTGTLSATGTASVGSLTSTGAVTANGLITASSGMAVTGNSSISGRLSGLTQLDLLSGTNSLMSVTSTGATLNTNLSGITHLTAQDATFTNATVTGNFVSNGGGMTGIGNIAVGSGTSTTFSVSSAGAINTSGGLSISNGTTSTLSVTPSGALSTAGTLTSTGLSVNSGSGNNFSVSSTGAVSTLSGMNVGPVDAATYTVASTGETTQSGALSVKSGGANIVGDTVIKANNFSFAASDSTTSDLNVYISPNWRFQVPKGTTNNTLSIQYNPNPGDSAGWIPASSFTA